ncbi:MAG: hypothetical protein WA970_11780 [Gammaproteobacteria bacterium]
MLRLKQIFLDPGLSATAKTIFIILSGLALTPEAAGSGVLTDYLKTDAEDSEIALASLAGELTQYMPEDITEIERAARELEEYWREGSFSAGGF